MGALFSSKKRTSPRGLLQDSSFQTIEDSRPSNSFFQIARGSGATLRECTFFSKKVHVTKKTSSRQITSRPHDKKNPDLAISELFLIKNPGICSGTLQRRIRVNSKEDPLAPCAKKQEARGLHPNGSTFSSKRYTPRKDLTKRYTVLLKKALGRRLFLLDKT